MMRKQLDSDIEVCWLAEVDRNGLRCLFERVVRTGFQVVVAIHWIRQSPCGHSTLETSSTRQRRRIVSAVCQSRFDPGTMTITFRAVLTATFFAKFADHLLHNLATLIAFASTHFAERMSTCHTAKGSVCCKLWRCDLQLARLTGNQQIRLDKNLSASY